MRGHIRKRSKNSWTIVVDLGRDPITGKRKQHWQSVKGTKKQAEQILNELFHSMEKGVYVKPTNRTIADFLLQWLRDYVQTNTSPRTASRYSEIVHRHLITNLGHIPLSQLRPEHIQAYYAKALTNGRLDGKGGLSPQTVKHIHRVLSEALHHGVKWGILTRNVASAVDPPRPVKKEITIVDVDDIALLLDEASKLEKRSGLPYYILFYTALHTGMRRGELLALRWCDIDLNIATISVTRSLLCLRNGSLEYREPKTNKSRRTIAMTPSLATKLREHRISQESFRIAIGKLLNQNDLIFSRPDGSPITPNTVSPAFSKIAKRAGLTMRLHDLRHTHASMMLKAGIHPKIVSERLGHSTVSFTLDVYSHVVPGLQEAAARTFDESFSKARPSTMEKQGIF
ncbi:MAG: site-specific integrase [Dehalococcoidia bacterium]